MAILSTEEFDASTDVDRASLTFGRTGDEQSLAFCFGWRGDVNCDGLRDLICFFRTRDTGIGSVIPRVSSRARQSVVFH